MKRVNEAKTRRHTTVKTVILHKMKEIPQTYTWVSPWKYCCSGTMLETQIHQVLQKISI